jgi:hypothetical protein
MSLDEDNVAAIEKELMRDYIKLLYESFLDLEEDISVPVTRKKNNTAIKYSNPPVKKKEEVAPPPPPPTPNVVVTPPPPPPPSRVIPSNPPPPKVVTQEPKVVYQPPKVSQPLPPPPPPPPVKEASPKSPPRPIIPEPIKNVSNYTVDPEHTDLFRFNLEAKELSEKLSQTRITDLSKAMGVNERIFTVNELFGADNSLYRNVIRDLNAMKSFEEAKAYLSSNIAERFNWTHKSKRNKAKNFIKLVRRRYI